MDVLATKPAYNNPPAHQFMCCLIEGGLIGGSACGNVESDGRGLEAGRVCETHCDGHERLQNQFTINPISNIVLAQHTTLDRRQSVNSVKSTARGN